VLGIAAKLRAQQNEEAARRRGHGGLWGEPVQLAYGRGSLVVVAKA
jgi:hypothetical protein